MVSLIKHWNIGKVNFGKYGREKMYSKGSLNSNSTRIQTTWIPVFHACTIWVNGVFITLNGWTQVKLINTYIYVFVSLVLKTSDKLAVVSTQLTCVTTRDTALS